MDIEPGSSPSLGIVVPCYNEEEVLPETAQRLISLLDRLIRDGLVDKSSGIYFVDDGSHDRTWPIIQQVSASNKSCNGIKLSRNRGHQNAILAGMMTVPGDLVVTIDADLQDDLDAIEEMVKASRSGSDIVYGVRSSRTVDTFFKRLTAETYYRLLSFLGVEVVFNHADFRLLSRRAIEALGAYDEVNLFVRGIIPQLGFQTSVVHYERQARTAGESKYHYSSMVRLALDGVTSFSARPLRWITVTGVSVFLLSVFVGIWAIVTRLVNSEAVPGWASTVLPICFFGGVQLLSIGIIGEYLAKIYMETKRRPRYFVEETTRGTNDDVQLGSYAGYEKSDRASAST